jgi:hypothetical protein
MKKSLVGTALLSRASAYAAAAGAQTSLIDLGSLGGTQVFATGINNAGPIVSDCLLAGDHNQHELAINDNGWIVSEGIDSRSSRDRLQRVHMVAATRSRGSPGADSRDPLLTQPPTTRSHVSACNAPQLERAQRASNAPATYFAHWRSNGTAAPAWAAAP